MTYDQWKDPTPCEGEPEPCKICGGTGYVFDFADCLQWCDECGASGLTFDDIEDDICDHSMYEANFTYGTALCLSCGHRWKMSAMEEENAARLVFGLSNE